MTMTHEEQVTMARQVLGKHFTKEEVAEILAMRLLKDDRNPGTGKAASETKKNN